MKLKRAPKKAMPETIVALIDVVFFLLVFFMLIGRMDATSPFEVTPAIAQTGADMPAGGATLSVGASGEFALDSNPIARAQILGQVTEMLGDKPDLLIRINAHKDAQLRNILPLVAELEGIGAKDIVLVVTPEAG